jgi:hypothetical protein
MTSCGREAGERALRIHPSVVHFVNASLVRMLYKDHGSNAKKFP